MKYERFSFNILHEGTKYQKVLFVIKKIARKDLFAKSRLVLCVS